jgi:hypothetical protein
MDQIYTGQFDGFDEAYSARAELRMLGIADGDMEIFALNPPGQHARFPIGGDEDADRGARGGENGALAGAALGGVAGLALGAAAIPIAGPIAAAAGMAAGAYAGSLTGAVSTMGDDGNAAQVPPRPAGVRLAVHTIPPIQRERVLAAMRRHGARSIEEASGIWDNASWKDFDPVSTPRWIDAPH